MYDGGVEAGQHAAVTALVRTGKHRTGGVGVVLGARKVGNEKNWVYLQR